MLTATKNLPKSRVTLTITGSVADFRAAYTTELSRVVADTRIPGFRKGHAPEAKVLQMVGRASVESKALDELVNTMYQAAVREAGVTPVSYPQIEIEKMQLPTEELKDADVILELSASLDVFPDLSIAGYEKVKLQSRDQKMVTDTEVSTMLDYLQRQYSEIGEEQPNAPIAKGSWVEISFAGTVDGEAKEGMQSDSHALMIGSGQLIPGFEEALIGLKVSESKTFKVPFPADYHATDLAGKEAEFTVEVKAHNAMAVPEINDAFAERFDQPDLETLKRSIATSLMAERAQEQVNMQQNEVVEWLLEHCKEGDLPETMVGREQNRLFEEGRSRLSQGVGQWEKYLESTGQTEEAIKEGVREQAEKNVRLGILLGKVAEAEGIADGETSGGATVERLRQIALKNVK